MKNIEEFWYLFVQSNVDGIWVSETFFLPDFSDLSIACDDYVVYRADRFSHAGGVAIYVNKKLNSVLREISVDYTDVIITGDLKSNILRDKHLLDSFEYIGLFSLTTTRDTLLGLSFVDVPNKILLYDQHSDNGKTFLGAATLLSRDFMRAVQESVTDTYSHQGLHTWEDCGRLE